MIKAELGAAGRGAIRTDGMLTASQRGWLVRTLRQQGAVVVEPWLPRVLDLSFHFTLTDAGARYEGTTRFFTDARVLDTISNGLLLNAQVIATLAVWMESKRFFLSSSSVQKMESARVRLSRVRFLG